MKANGLKQVQRTEAGDLGWGAGQLEADTYEALNGRVVDLIGLCLLHQSKAGGQGAATEAGRHQHDVVGLFRHGEADTDVGCRPKLWVLKRVIWMLLTLPDGGSGAVCPLCIVYRAVDSTSGACRLRASRMAWDRLRGCRCHRTG